MRLFPHQNSDFNPRSREGSDCDMEAALPLAYISIHAPARGATMELENRKASWKFQSTLPRGERRNLSDCDQQNYYFNPRSREGSDNITKATTAYYIRFQSTLPRGERLYWSLKLPGYRDFNPRSREGSDMPRRPVRSEGSYFNPRSREGSDGIMVR